MSGDVGLICRGTLGKSDKRLKFTTASALAASAWILLVLAATNPALMSPIGSIILPGSSSGPITPHSASVRSLA